MRPKPAPTLLLLASAIALCSCGTTKYAASEATLIQCSERALEPCEPGNYLKRGAGDEAVDEGFDALTKLGLCAERHAAAVKCLRAIERAGLAKPENR